MQLKASIFGLLLAAVACLAIQADAIRAKRRNCAMTICQDIYQPVCGTDGKTYSNECVMNGEACQSGLDIKVAHKGECQESRSKNNPCNVVNCGYGARCVSQNGKAKCICPEICNQMADPLCGSDGNTYGNECAMNVAMCKEKKQIQIAHKGKCESKDCDY